MPALVRPALIAATFSAALCWATAGAAASGDVDPVAPQPAHAPTARVPAQGSAEHAPPERSASYTLRVKAPERASLHFSVGVGGGSVGVAGRVGGDAEYWVLDNVGIGVLGALGGQGVLFGNTFNYAFVGPALLLRDRARESGFFVTTAFGFMNGGYTEDFSGGGPASCDFDCNNPNYDIRAPGVVLSAGLAGRAGSVDLGGAVVVDLISAQLETPRWLNTVTFNLSVGVPIL